MKPFRVAFPLLGVCAALRFSCFASDVLTYHNDNRHTGWNPGETKLNPANVNVTQFGLLKVLPVDAPVFAQPLYVSGVSVKGGVHNLVIVATENDSVYAFDADSFATVWGPTRLLGAGEQPAVPWMGCTDLMFSNTSSPTAPALGITATPVVDRGMGPQGTIYVLAMSMNSSKANQFFARLHALNLSTGQEVNTPKLKSPVTIKATYPTRSGSLLTFNPQIQRGRPALLLQNGIIYTGWGSQCDIQPYYGWVIAYAEATLKQTAVLNTNPNQDPTAGLGGGGVWGSGGGLTGSPEGSVYFMTGDGLFDDGLNGDPPLNANGFPSAGDYGDSFVRVSQNLSVLDYLAPSNQSNLAADNIDLGSGGVVVLPDMKDSSGNTWSLAIGAGKGGTVYLVNRKQMGKYNNGAQDNVYQEFSLPPPDVSIWGSPAFFNDGTENVIYFGPEGSPLLKYVFVNAKLTGPTATSNTICGTNPNYLQFPGTTPSISSNGANATTAVVWAYQNENAPPDGTPRYGTPVLRAYDANLNELYCSQENPADDLGNPSNSAHLSSNAAKFVVPTVCNGKVFVGTTNSVAVFGSR